MPKIKSFEIFSKNAPLGELKDLEWGDQTILYAQCHTGHVPYGLIIGFRVEKKKPDEKVGDVIKVIAIDEERRDLEDLEMTREMNQLFSSILEGQIRFFW